MTPLELIAVLITFISVWLTAVENIWCWPTGIVSVILYTWINWQARLYGNAWLQVIYLVLNIYGWWAWLYGGEHHDELPVARTPWRAWVVIATTGIGSTAGLALWMHAHTDASMPWTDAGTTVFSVLAQVMMTRKWIENWIFWILIDIVTTWIYIEQKLTLSAILYFAMIFVAAYGWIKWKRSVVSV